MWARGFHPKLGQILRPHISKTIVCNANFKTYLERKTQDIILIPNLTRFATPLHIYQLNDSAALHILPNIIHTQDPWCNFYSTIIMYMLGSRLYSHSSWPLKIRKGSAICLISILFSYLNEDTVECMESNRSLNITGKTGRSSKHMQNCFPKLHSAKKSV